MKNVYACLLGEWVNLSESNDVVIDNAYTDVNLWYKEQIDNLFNFNYINFTTYIQWFKVYITKFLRVN